MDIEERDIYTEFCKAVIADIASNESAFNADVKTEGGNYSLQVQGGHSRSKSDMERAPYETTKAPVTDSNFTNNTTEVLDTDGVFTKHINSTIQPDKKHVYLPPLTTSTIDPPTDHVIKDGDKVLRLPKIDKIPSSLAHLALNKSITDLLDPEMDMVNKVRYGSKKARKRRNKNNNKNAGRSFFTNTTKTDTVTNNSRRAKQNDDL